MFESKYGKVLTVILSIVIILIIGLVGFLIYNWYNNNVLNKDAGDFVDDFVGSIDGDNTDDGYTDGDLEGVDDPDIGGSGSGGLKTYHGYVVLGTIEIPKTGVKYPILEQNATGALEVAVVKLYGVGLNEVGNVVIAGHNYRNGMFFSNNAKLESGDKIYITNNAGEKVSYTIYNKFQATPEDTSFYARDTEGKPEVTLSSCTDDSKNRIIIEARAE